MLKTETRKCNRLLVSAMKCEELGSCQSHSYNKKKAEPTEINNSYIYQRIEIIDKHKALPKKLERQAKPENYS